MVMKDIPPADMPIPKLIMETSTVFTYKCKKKIHLANKDFLPHHLLCFSFATDVMSTTVREELDGERMLYGGIQNAGGTHTTGRRGHGRRYVQIQKKPFEFPIELLGLL